MTGVSVVGAGGAAGIAGALDVPGMGVVGAGSLAGGLGVRYGVPVVRLIAVLETCPVAALGFGTFVTDSRLRRPVAFLIQFFSPLRVRP